MGGLAELAFGTVFSILFYGVAYICYLLLREFTPEDDDDLSLYVGSRPRAGGARSATDASVTPGGKEKVPILREVGGSSLRSEFANNDDRLKLEAGG